MHHSAQPAHLAQHLRAHHGHGAVLDDGVAVVAGHHADVEKALVLGVAHLLEQGFVAVAVVLRGLDETDGRVGEIGDEVAQPARGNLVVAVDDRDHLGVGGGLPQREVEGAGLEAGQRRHVEEAEAFAEGGAVGFDRPPDRLVLGVVVDDQDLEVGIVEGRQGVEGCDQHLRRLVVGRHVDRHLGMNPAGLQLPFRGAGEETPPLFRPARLGQFVGLGEQDAADAQKAEQQADADGDGQQALVLVGVIVDHPDQGRGDTVGEQGQEAAPAAPQAVAVGEKDQGGRQPEADGEAGEQLPLGDAPDRLGEGELLLAVDVEHPPVGAHRPLRFGLPGLVEGLHQVIIVVLLLRELQEVAQEDRLVGLGGDSRAPGSPVARPADLGHEDPLFRVGLPQHVVGGRDVTDGARQRHPFPVGEEMGGDEVGMPGQFRVLQPDVPGLAGTDREFQHPAHPVEIGAQLVHGQIAAQDRLVADDHLDDVVTVRPGHLDQPFEFPFVLLQVVGQPGPQGHLHAMLGRQPRNFRQGAAQPVGADSPHLPLQQAQVGIDFRYGRILSGHGIVAQAQGEKDIPATRAGQGGSACGRLPQPQRRKVARPKPQTISRLSQRADFFIVSGASCWQGWRRWNG